ncbi:MAG TPA: dienelactone hydrolase family protein [Pirellulales bacterium]|jgi:carboxymethylenebutenolidase|nr:dienelactone hydrolase family protein [Pirellulales bacterium]
MKWSLVLALLVAIGSSASAQEWAKAKLEKSPRHQEWVKVKHGQREVNCFIVYPEVKEKATAVVFIHEIFGLSDWVRSAADELAAEGYIVIVPDLVSGMGPKGGGSEEYTRDSITKAVSSLPPDQVTADLNAVVKYVSELPAANGKVAVAGFCWGGGQSFRFATNNKTIKAALVFYGTGPEADATERIACPVFGFYGGNDARVSATVPKTTELMKKLKKTYEPVTYEGAGHGFMRAGEEPNANEKNKKARDEAWKRMLEILKKI